METRSTTISSKPTQAKENQKTCNKPTEILEKFFLENLGLENKTYETEIIISLLSEIIKKRINYVISYPSFSFFYAFYNSINIKQYLLNCIKHLPNINLHHLLAMTIYLNRYENSSTKNIITEKNIFQLILAALLIAYKFWEDIPYNNLAFSKAAGVPLKELNLLEIEFLKTINYNLYISPEEYNYLQDLIISSKLFKTFIETSVIPHDPAAKYHFNFFQTTDVMKKINDVHHKNFNKINDYI